MWALKEFGATLYAAWAAADLKRRLKEWWWCITHQALLD